MAVADTELEEKLSTKLQPPSMWKVVFLNDNHTPMEFVIGLLMKIFKHTEVSAAEVTLEIHNTGSGVAGIYSYEIAEQKGLEATQVSRSNGYPLKIQVEQEK
jgi:ATP-dependent Clp protease adaptor protein ClpS